MATFFARCASTYRITSLRFTKRSVRPPRPKNAKRGRLPRRLPVRLMRRKRRERMQRKARRKAKRRI